MITHRLIFRRTKACIRHGAEVICTEVVPWNLIQREFFRGLSKALSYNRFIKLNGPWQHVVCKRSYCSDDLLLFLDEMIKATKCKTAPLTSSELSTRPAPLLVTRLTQWASIEMLTELATAPILAFLCARPGCKVLWSKACSMAPPGSILFSWTTCRWR